MKKGEQPPHSKEQKGPESYMPLEQKQGSSFCFLSNNFCEAVARKEMGEGKGGHFLKKS